MFKKFMTMVLMTAMIMALISGCGSSSGNSDGNGTVGQKETSDGSGAAGERDNSAQKSTAGADGSIEASDSSEQITLEFFNQKVEIVNILNELFEAYMVEHPNVKIEVVSPSDSATVLTTRVSNGDVPDIYTHWPKEESYALVKAGAAMDLAGTGVLDNISDSARDVWNTWLANKDISGEYCATISYNFSGLWYNKDIFKDAGYEEFPATWDELMEACEKIKTQGITPIEIAGLNPGDTLQQLYICMASGMSGEAYAAFLADSTSGKVDASSSVYGEELLSIGNKMAQLVSYAQTDILGSDGESASADFATGKTAMFMNGSWKYPTIIAANPDINCALAPIPGTAAQDTKVAAYPGDFGVWVSSSLEGTKKDAALELVAWMASKDFAQSYAEKDGSPSCIKGVDYVAEPLSYVYNNFIANNSYILNPDCNWTAAQNDTVGSVVQQLYSDGYADAFVQNLANALNNNLD